MDTGYAGVYRQRIIRSKIAGMNISTGWDRIDLACRAAREWIRTEAPDGDGEGSLPCCGLSLVRSWRGSEFWTSRLLVLFVLWLCGSVIMRLFPVRQGAGNILPSFTTM